MRATSSLAVASATLILMLSACGGAGSGQDEEAPDFAETRDFEMTVALGAVVGATCDVIGRSGSIITRVETDQNGTANVVGVPVTEFPVELACRGGSFYDEGSEQTTTIGESEVIRSLVPDEKALAQLNGSIAVTPLTDLAAALFLSLPRLERNSETASAALEEIRAALVPSLGSAGADILRAPQVVNSPESTIAGNTPDAQYAAYLAGLAIAGQGSGLDAMQTLQLLRDDITDGNPDLDNSGTILSQIVVGAQEFAQAKGDDVLTSELAEHEVGDGRVSQPGVAQPEPTATPEVTPVPTPVPTAAPTSTPVPTPTSTPSSTPTGAQGGA